MQGFPSAIQFHCQFQLSFARGFNNANTSSLTDVAVATQPQHEYIGRYQNLNLRLVFPPAKCFRAVLPMASCNEARMLSAQHIRFLRKPQLALLLPCVTVAATRLNCNVCTSLKCSHCNQPAFAVTLSSGYLLGSFGLLGAQFCSRLHEEANCRRAAWWVGGGCWHVCGCGGPCEGAPLLRCWLGTGDLVLASDRLRGVRVP